MPTIEKLLSVAESDYGAKYREHCLALYQLYVQSAEKNSDRRHGANKFFLTVNSALLGLTGYLQAAGTGSLWMIALAGLVISYTWYRLILSYREMNSAKFQVIHEIEKHLPFALYDAEWEIVEHGRKSGGYKPYSKSESAVPLVFMVLHGFVAVAVLAGVMSGNG